MSEERLPYLFYNERPEVPGGDPDGTAPHVAFVAGTYCPICDYELRGVTGTVCPECGSTLPKNLCELRSRRPERRVRWVLLILFGSLSLYLFYNGAMAGLSYDSYFGWGFAGAVVGIAAWRLAWGLGRTAEQRRVWSAGALGVLAVAASGSYLAHESIRPPTEAEIGAADLRALHAAVLNHVDTHGGMPDRIFVLAVAGFRPSANGPFRLHVDTDGHRWESEESFEAELQSSPETILEFAWLTSRIPDWDRAGRLHMSLDINAWRADDPAVIVAHFGHYAHGPQERYVLWSDGDVDVIQTTQAFEELREKQNKHMIARGLQSIPSAAIEERVPPRSGGRGLGVRFPSDALLHDCFSTAGLSGVLDSRTAESEWGIAAEAGGGEAEVAEPGAPTAPGG